MKDRFYKPTKKYIETMRYYARRFNQCEGATIYNVYGRCSDCKRNAYEALKAKAENGDCRVIGHNCNFFTTAMVSIHPETGEVVFRVDTASNTYMIAIDYVEDIVD